MMAEPNRFAVAGRKGGLRRRSTTSPERRSEIAKQGAAARWGNTEAHRVVRLMIEKIVTTGTEQRLYMRGKSVWFAESGHMEESRWMEWCVGTYGIGCSFTDIITDVVEG